MLILLQPGIQPLGQFDIYDENIDVVKGGEVAAFESLDLSDTYASDAGSPGPQVQLKLGIANDSSTFTRNVWGLVDEGTSGGFDIPMDGPPATLYASGNRGYGTSFGKTIGITVGQGTGLGELGSSGAVVIGPSTIRGSGKATLWTKPGLYGVTADAFVDIKDFDGAAGAINTKLYGTPSTGKLRGTSGGAPETHVAYSLRGSTDTSLVSTPPYYANTGKKFYDYCVIYFVGCQ